MLIRVAFWFLEYTSHPEISRSPKYSDLYYSKFLSSCKFSPLTLTLTLTLNILIKIHFVSLHNFSFLSSIIRPKLTKCLVIDSNDWHSGLSFVLTTSWIIQGSSLLTFFLFCYKVQLWSWLTGTLLQWHSVLLAWRLDQEMRRQLILHETAFTRWRFFTSYYIDVDTFYLFLN